MARGRDKALKFFQAFDETWQRHRTDQEEVRAVGADRVLVFSVERFVGRDGIEVSAPAAGVFTLRAGKIIRWEAF